MNYKAAKELLEKHLNDGKIVLVEPIEDDGEFFPLRSVSLDHPKELTLHYSDAAFSGELSICSYEGDRISISDKSGRFTSDAEPGRLYIVT